APPSWSGAGAATASGLPRRTRGGGLQSELHDTPPPPAGTDLLDPEVVRARLTALSAGVAQAMRRNQQTRHSGRPE
ncbi:hypothetical protein, partial [Verrucosispora sp. SN26_14.1]